MSIRIRELESCFRGVVPATIATCSPEGVPNVTYLSVVHCLDDERIALSFQFFNKTRENILANPKAQLLVLEPTTMVQYRIDVEYLHTEHEGPVFERMRTNLDAVASMTGMTGVFRLQGADIYRVLRISELPHDLDLSAPVVAADFLGGLEALSARLAQCDELDAVLDATLGGIAELFDYRHSMLLFADEAGTRLFTVASHGFASSGVGAEVSFGDGVIGTAALEQKPVTVNNVLVEQTLADAVQTTARERGEPIARAHEIALPGRADAQSQVAVPLLARGRTLGVLCVQSERAGRFTRADEQVLATLARSVATAIQLLGHSGSADAPMPRSYVRRPADGEAMKVRWHACDDSVFVDDEYLVKGLPGRMLYRLLATCERDGRVDFTLRELRLDESLQVGGQRDNLDARLILLRQRLEERTSDLRIVKTGRGRFRLQLERSFELRRVE
ncbi:MAG TPA: GAF domain-containing protein [Nannocystaceae bacterium]|nr:GAF domain-containing protein [Nannocystaceae bacterium]